eukprot:2896555-Pleurochrysis_carterae.AAC.1
MSDTHLDFQVMFQTGFTMRRRCAGPPLSKSNVSAAERETGPQLSIARQSCVRPTSAPVQLIHCFSVQSQRLCTSKPDKPGLLDLESRAPNEACPRFRRKCEACTESQPRAMSNLRCFQSFSAFAASSRDAFLAAPLRPFRASQGLSPAP